MFCRRTEDWTADRSEELNEEFYENLRAAYTVIVEEPAAADALASLPEPAR